MGTLALLDESWMFALSEPARSIKFKTADVLITVFSAESADVSSSLPPS